MSILGLGNKTKKTTANKSVSAADEAKAELAKMEAKKQAGACPFC